MVDPKSMIAIAEKIAQELSVNTKQIQTAITLLDSGATVPFIARYRKEATGGLSDNHLRRLQERLDYLRDLEQRREVVLTAIKEQGKLSAELEKAIFAADTKTRLEDLYLPYKPKRRTKAQIARLSGLQSLAEFLLSQPQHHPVLEAVSYLNPDKGVLSTQQALEGAKQILMETFAENANLLEALRNLFWQNGQLEAKLIGDKVAAQKFKDYFEHQEAIKNIPSHRALALFRGRREGHLSLTLTLKDGVDPALALIATHFNIKNEGRNADPFLQQALHHAFKIKLATKIELELLSQLKEKAEDEAIKVFSLNLKDLLLAAPAGEKVTLGLDPGIRTGVKVVVVDSTGKLLDYTALFPLPPQNDWFGSIAELAKLTAQYNVALISIGNGTGSRETERLVTEMLSTYSDLKAKKVMVNEAGASVYSASLIAEKEFPELDVSYRGAVSIARRLQDPLAELVKIEPKSIGVGQYQHDVNQVKLSRALDAVVEDCVNAVGVDVNTASSALLKRISGLNEGLANNIVSYRDEHGKFSNRAALKAVPRMGDITFQQAAGFLRINNGKNPLDSSAVHPESYTIVEKILSHHNKSLTEVLGNSEFLKHLNLNDYVDENTGLPTLKDIVKELEKPGRDPRGEFKTANFKEGIETIKDLKKEMILEGVITNVTNFGAFVDIGVHQDGLVHLSELTDKFIRDPRIVVKAGDVVKVKVIEVDKVRKRISLSMKLNAVKPERREKPSKNIKPSKVKPQTARPKVKAVKEKKLFNTAMADALSKLKQK